MATNVTFNGTSLQTANIFMKVIDHDSIPDKVVQSTKLARADGAKISDVRYAPKKIRLEGRVEGSSPADLESRLDSLRLLLSAQEKNLDIDYNGTTRRYVATVTGFIVKRSSGSVNFADFSVDLLATQAFGSDTGSTTLLNASALSASPSTKTLSPAVGGSAPDQHLLVTVTFSAITGGAGQYVKIEHPSTGQYIRVDRTWSNTDVLVVDGVNKTVTVNGSPIDYSGNFPAFAPGDTSIKYSDGFSARTATITVSQVKRYL